MRNTQGSIWLSTGLKPGTRITAYLRLKGAPWSTHHRVTLRVGQPSPVKQPVPFPALARSDEGTLHIAANTEFLARVSGKMDQDGTITIALDVHGEAVTDHPARHKDDDRIFYVGVVALAYAVSSDVELRVDLFERLSHLG